MATKTLQDIRISGNKKIVNLQELSNNKVWSIPRILEEVFFQSDTETRKEIEKIVKERGSHAEWNRYMDKIQSILNNTKDQEQKDFMLHVFEQMEDMEDEFHKLDTYSNEEYETYEHLKHVFFEALINIPAKSLDSNRCRKKDQNDLTRKDYLFLLKKQMLTYTQEKELLKATPAKKIINDLISDFI